MNIKPVTQSNVSSNNIAKQEDVKKNTSKNVTSKNDLMNQGVVFEKSKDEPIISGDYSNLNKDKTKLSEIERMKLEVSHKMENAFQLMVEDVMSGQNIGMKAAIENLLKNRENAIDGDSLGEQIDKDFEITPEMVEEAQADIAEGGFYSVEAVTERIMNFAKAISEDDPTKASLLRGAFEDGFNEAAKIWGDELPQISKDTYDSVMNAFDEWENEIVEA